MEPATEEVRKSKPLVKSKELNIEETGIKIDKVKLGYSVRIGNEQETFYASDKFEMRLVNILPGVPVIHITSKKSKKSGFATLYNCISFETVSE